MLVDHANTQVDGIGRRSNCDRLSIQKDFPFIRVIQAIENLHQCAFAGTILAQQGVDFAGFHIEIHPVIGKHTGKALGDAAHFKAVNASLARWKSVFDSVILSALLYSINYG